jgi:hypothetical protein
MESNAGGMVRRRALKTRFSDKGMGFDSSALRQSNAPLDKSGKVASLKRKSSLGSTPRRGTIQQK